MQGTGLSLLLAAAAVLGMSTQPRAQTAAELESLLHDLLDAIATRAPDQDLALFGPPRLRPLGEDWSGRLPAFRWRASDSAIGNVLAVETMPVTASLTPEGLLVLAFSPPATFEIGSDRTVPPGAPTARGDLEVRPNASWRPIVANVAIVPPLRALMGVHIEAADIVLPRVAFAETRAASGAIALTSTFRGDRRHDQEFRVTVDGARVTAPSLDLALAHAEAWMRLDAARLDSFWVWGAGFASFDDWAGRPGAMAPDQEAALVAAIAGDDAVVDGIANGVEVTGLRADWLAQTIVADSAALGFTVTGLRTGSPTVEVAASVSGLDVAGPGSPIDPDLVPRHAIAEIAVTGLDFHDYALSVGRTLGAWADVPTPYDAVNLAFGQVLAFDGWDTGRTPYGPLVFTLHRLHVDAAALWLDLTGTATRLDGGTGMALDLEFDLAADLDTAGALTELLPPAFRGDAALQALLDLGMPAGEAPDGRPLRHYHLLTDGQGAMTVNGTDVAPLLEGR